MVKINYVFLEKKFHIPFDFLFIVCDHVELIKTQTWSHLEHYFSLMLALQICLILPDIPTSANILIQNVITFLIQQIYYFQNFLLPSLSVPQPVHHQ